MSKFIRVKNNLINVDEIALVDCRRNWDVLTQKYTNYSITIYLKNKSTSKFDFDAEDKMADLFNEISEKLEAVKV